MTPEEKLYFEAWRLLQEIKEKYLATPKKQPPPPRNEYIFHIKPHGVEIRLHYDPLFSFRRNILYKMEEWKLLKVLDERRGDFNHESTGFILEVLQPRFDKVYQAWENINGNPWFSEAGKIVRIKKLLEGKRKEFKEIDYGFEKRQKKLTKKMAERYEEMVKREREELERLERLRIEKLTKSRKSEFEYATDRLIELATIYNDEKIFQISAYKLGFPATIGGAVECHKFLNKLKEEGCFEKVEKLPDNITFKITKLNVENLKKYKTKIETLKEKETIQIQKEERQNKFPYGLPAGTEWEHLIMQFIDGYTIGIKFSNFKLNRGFYKETYEGMGLEDKRKKKPNVLWELLQKLAENDGEIDWKSPWASNKIKKRKSLLANTLKKYFSYQIPGDPFFYYRKEKCYKTKFQIFSENYIGKEDLKKYFSEKELENLKKQKEIEEQYQKEIKSDSNKKYLNF